MPYQNTFIKSEPALVKVKDTPTIGVLASSDPCSLKVLLKPLEVRGHKSDSLVRSVSDLFDGRTGDMAERRASFSSAWRRSPDECLLRRVNT